MVSALIQCQHCFQGGIASLRQNKSKFSARMVHSKFSGLWLFFFFFFSKIKVLIETVMFLLLDQQITLDPEIMRADMKAFLLSYVFSIVFLF